MFLMNITERAKAHHLLDYYYATDFQYYSVAHNNNK